MRRVRRVVSPGRRAALWTTCLYAVVSLAAGTVGRIVPLPPGPRPAVPPAGKPAPVVIDAGHGGIDGGARYGAMLEKDLNLDIARRVAAALQAEGVETLLTRDADVDFSRTSHRADIRYRAAFAKERGARVLVSIHANYSSDPRASGTLVLHPPEDARAAAYAAAIHGELRASFPDKRHALRGEKLYLFEHTAVPTVVVEAGFLSNAADRADLAREEYRERFARAVASAIRR